MRRNFHRATALACVLLPAGACRGAQTSGDIQARPIVIIRLEHGAVDVRGDAATKSVTWTTKPHAHKYVPQISLHHRKTEDDSGEVSIRSAGNQVEIYSEHALDLVVTVPEATTMLDVRSGQGDVSVKNVSGQLRMQTNGGKLMAEQVRGTVEGQTGGGDIFVRKTGPMTKLETGGGNITVDAAGGGVTAGTSGGNISVTSAKGAVRLETGGGNLTLQQADGAVRLETGGGNIEMGDMGSDVSAETRSGSIRLASARGMVQLATGSGSIDCRQLGSALRAETASGRITAQFVGGTRNESSTLNSDSGDVVVYMPARLGFAVRVQSGNPWGHDIRSEFADVHVQSGQGRPLRADGVVNGGGPLLSVNAANGNVQILRGH